MNKINKQFSFRKGSALLVVLIVVMFVSIISVGFISSSDTQLFMGENMAVNAQSNYAAQSGFAHAKNLLLRRWDIDTGSDPYWLGTTGVQLASDSDYYYDITISESTGGVTPQLGYDVLTTGYRLDAGVKKGQVSLKGVLRLDPAVAFYCDGNWITNNHTEVYGDVVVEDGSISGDIHVFGDVWGDDYISIHESTGLEREHLSTLPLGEPAINSLDYSSNYHIENDTYSVATLAPGSYSSLNLTPTATNPAGVYYCSGNLGLVSNNYIKGMLVVDGELKIYGQNNVCESYEKLPAVLVDEKLVFQNDSTQLTVNGMCILKKELCANVNYFDFTVNGALIIGYGGIQSSTNTGDITINIKPEKCFLQTWNSSGNYYNYSTIVGASYTQIDRQ